MVIMRNHEEEVGLRLQFEARVNQLNTEYRELEIRHNRAAKSLEQAAQDCSRLDALSKDQSEQLIKLRTKEIDQATQLEALKSFKL